MVVLYPVGFIEPPNLISSSANFPIRSKASETIRCFSCFGVPHQRVEDYNLRNHLERDYRMDLLDEHAFSNSDSLRSTKFGLLISSTT
ncbi:MAG: hypothetical protein CM15mP49_13750 [Actinomycetota bacterium]|nr:MAG: hypothetical protein CM15mP49_13750 [Actinomycetota bacterium]